MPPIASCGAIQTYLPIYHTMHLGMSRKMSHVADSSARLTRSLRDDLLALAIALLLIHSPPMLKMRGTVAAENLPSLRLSLSRKSVSYVLLATRSWIGLSPPFAFASASASIPITFLNKLTFAGWTANPAFPLEDSHACSIGGFARSWVIDTSR